MPQLAIYYCAKCKKRIDILDAYYTIGVPFLKCPTCSTINVIADNRNEWDLKTPYQRFSSATDALGLGLILGGGAGFVISLAVQEVFKFHSNFMHLLLAAVGGYIAFPIASRRLRQTIDESRKRMENLPYRSFVEGLLGKTVGVENGGETGPRRFADGPEAFEFTCKSLDCPLHAGSVLPALVLDQHSTYGAEYSVETLDDGIQVALLKVASDDGGFVVFAHTSGPVGPRLRPGDLVAWKAGRHEGDVAGRATGITDERSDWIGLITRTLKPVLHNGSWVDDATFHQ